MCHRCLISLFHIWPKISILFALLRHIIAACYARSYTIPATINNNKVAVKRGSLWYENNSHMRNSHYKNCDSKCAVPTISMTASPYIFILSLSLSLWVFFFIFGAFSRLLCSHAKKRKRIRKWLNEWARKLLFMKWFFFLLHRGLFWPNCRYFFIFFLSFSLFAKVCKYLEWINHW